MISTLIKEMCAYEAGNAARINHFLKVHAFAAAIGNLEGLPEETRFVLEAAAVVHDIGVKPALEQYDSAEGVYQQTEGPPAARAMLSRLGFAEDVIRRVEYLVAHHHEYAHIDGDDYQILVEADLLVNISEGNVVYSSGVKQKIFRTASGIFFFEKLYETELSPDDAGLSPETALRR
jgi:HD superfamily phosphodiesterase